MAPLPNPVILYHPDGYQTARADLKGRHSAGASFLSAFLGHVEGPDVFGLLLNAQGAEDFRATVQASERPLSPRVITRADIATIRTQGLLYVPDPTLAAEARVRSFLGEKSYAISGITHTISSRETVDQIASIVIEPAAPWDALICTSKAVHTAISTILTLGEEDMRARLGATRFDRPLMPIIPLGVHAERFARNDDDRTGWRDELGISGNTVAILFFGRLSVHAKASPFQLAQAAEKAAHRLRRPVTIIWCGWFNDAHQHRAFMQTAKAMAPSVSFHHVDGRDERARYTIWSAADIFCSLSDNIQESFGLTVIEAMAAGLPVVASNWNGYRTAIEHGVNGVLVDSLMPQLTLADAAYRYVTGLDSYDSYIGGVSQFCFVNIEQTADWIVRLSENEELGRSMGRAAQRTIAASFDWKVVIGQYFELWQHQSELLDVARKDERPVHSSTWRRHDPALTFAGYASHHLTGETRLAKGAGFTTWNDLLTEPGIVLNAHVLVRKGTLDKLHDAFEEAGEAGVAIADLLTRFSGNEHAALVRSLHWLIKIGLLALRSLPQT
jgi:glycosyltransferase involved in cell wall biosynthesis